MAFQALCLAIYSSEHVGVVPIMLSGDDTAQARNRLVRIAERAGADWILWIDNDMVFPPDALIRLLAHNLDIVGVDYRRRAIPFQRVGLLLRDEDGPNVPLAEARSKETGLLQMGVIGLGLVLVRMSVFTDLKMPWFGRSWAKEHATLGNPDGFSTEDSYFCHIARQAGHKIWCDLDLSRQVQHVGEVVVPYELSHERVSGNTAIAVPA